MKLVEGNGSDLFKGLLHLCEYNIGICSRFIILKGGPLIIMHKVKHVLYRYFFLENGKL
jgi:hypothetical protein